MTRSTVQNRAVLAERAIDAWGDSLYRLALSQLRSSADAQDVIQDVFLKLVEQDRAFQNAEHLKAWLIRVTVNRCRDVQRSAWRQKVNPFAGAADAEEANRRISALPDGSAPVEDQALAALYENPVWRLMGELPPDQRAAMHLRYVDEYTDDEIAQIMQVKPATVRTWLHRGRKRLRDLVDREEAGATSPGTRERALAPTTPTPSRI